MQTFLDTASFILAIGFVLAAFAFYVAATAILAWWMLEPINRAGGVLQATTRFLLSDVLGLMVMLQVALAISGVALDSSDRQEVAAYWLMLGVSALLACVLWAASVSVVSRAGIVLPLRRLTVIVLLIPGTLAVVMSIPLVIVLALSGMFDPHGALGLGVWRAYILPLAALGLLLLVGAIFVIRRLSFWALSPEGAALSRSVS
jgi:hypothetical protein